MTRRPQVLPYLQRCVRYSSQGTFLIQSPKPGVRFNSFDRSVLASRLRRYDFYACARRKFDCRLLVFD